MATLMELADLVGGSVVGDGTLEIRRLATIELAAPGEITFLNGLKPHRSTHVCPKCGVRFSG